MLLAIILLSSDSMFEIIGQSMKIWATVSLGAGSNRPPRAATACRVLVYNKVPVLNLNRNSQNSFVRKPHLKQIIKVGLSRFKRLRECTKF